MIKQNVILMHACNMEKCILLGTTTLDKYNPVIHYIQEPSACRSYHSPKWHIDNSLNQF